VRAIFVDFDGVLHDVDAVAVTYECYSMVITGERLFEHMPIFEHLLADHPDVHIVIHSSWRNHFPPDQLRLRFPESLRSRIHGVTMRGSQRYAGILDYAEAHGVSDYIILDDMPGEFCYDGPPPDELIICHEKHGIGSPSVQAQISEWLAATRGRE